MMPKLTFAQVAALRSVASGNNDCERLSTRVTRTLRTLGLLAFGEVNDRVAYVLTDAGRAELEARRR